MKLDLRVVGLHFTGQDKVRPGPELAVDHASTYPP